MTSAWQIRICFKFVVYKNFLPWKWHTTTTLGLKPSLVVGVSFRGNVAGFYKPTIPKSQLSHLQDYSTCKNARFEFSTIFVPSFDSNEWCLKNGLQSGGLNSGPVSCEYSALTTRPVASNMWPAGRMRTIRGSNEACQPIFKRKTENKHILFLLLNSIVHFVFNIL